ncbi:MAG: hypothetical protein GX242_04545 [Clostridiales bacterium]|nr:hypothetical protein [Clostridiales bacterium]
MRKRIIGLSATFIGTLIGAGFASGREIALYFSHTSPFTPLFSGACLGMLCFLFLELGRYYNGDFFVLLGKGRIFTLGVIKFFNAVVTCAMIAGGEGVIFALFGIHGGGIITGIITIITIIFGVEKLKLINSLAVPAIILLILILLFKGNNKASMEKISVLPSFTYATMNIMSGGYFISTLSKECSQKENAIIAIICGVLLGLMLLSVYLIIQQDLTSTMPLMSAATRYNLKIVGNLIMYLAIYTTITSSVTVSSGNNIIKAIIITAICYIVSLFSFEKIVDIFYPIMGISGAVLTFLTLFLMLQQRYSLLKLNIGKSNKAN